MESWFMKIKMHGMKKVTFVSQAEILIRGPAKCNTVVSHITTRDGTNVSEVNIFEIKLSVCALAQFTVTKYHRVACKRNYSMNSAEQVSPDC